MPKKGIDISVHQGVIDFAKVKSASVDFAIIRLGFGSSTVDEKFINNVNGCLNAGIQVKGVYLFSYAFTQAEAVAEAQFAIAQMKAAGLDNDVIVFYDFEYDTVDYAARNGVVLGPTECNAHAIAFCGEIERMGYSAGLYYNRDYWMHWYTLDTIRRYIAWVADYNATTDIPCVFHQYSATGKVDGINGDVDMNYYYGADAVEPPVTTPAMTLSEALNIFMKKGLLPELEALLVKIAKNLK